MKENVKETVTQILDNYLAQNNRRKTPERYAILETVYAMNGYFTLDELGKRLAEERRFPVSRATLYNTIKLFLKLRLIIEHHFQKQVTYSAAYNKGGQFFQICTLCGKVTDVKATALVKAVESMRLRRFKKDSYTLYIYGVCSSCQAKLTMEKKKQENKASK